jgi:hypothetical protein
MTLPAGWVTQNTGGATYAAPNTDALDLMISGAPLTMPGIITIILPMSDFGDAIIPADILTNELLRSLALSADDSSALSFGEPENIAIGGQPGTVASFSGIDTRRNQAVAGRIVTIAGNSHAGAIVGMAPEEQWIPFSTVFEEMTGSVAFSASN